MPGIRFITNTVYRDCVQIQNPGLSVSEGSIQNLAGGPIHLGAHVQYSSADKYVNYVRQADFSLVADAFVLLNGASGLTESHEYSIGRHRSTGDSEISTNEASGQAWNATNDPELLIGPYSDDIVLTFDEINDADQFYFEQGTPGASSDDLKFSKLFFGKSVLFDYPASTVLTGINQFVFTKDKAFRCDRQVTFAFEGVTQQDLIDFENQYNIYTDPVVLYDSEGNHLFEKVWYAVLQPVQVEPFFDDKYTVTMIACRVKRPQVIFV